jgi:hypothetical protein
MEGLTGGNEFRGPLRGHRIFGANTVEPRAIDQKQQETGGWSARDGTRLNLLDLHADPPDATAGVHGTSALR